MCVKGTLVFFFFFWIFEKQIVIYIYIYRERERERGQNKKLNTSTLIKNKIILVLVFIFLCQLHHSYDYIEVINYYWLNITFVQSKHKHYFSNHKSIIHCHFNKFYIKKKFTLQIYQIYCSTALFCCVQVQVNFNEIILGSLKNQSYVTYEHSNEQE